MYQANRYEWKKSSYSSGTGAACVEVAETVDAVAIRDSKLDTTGDFPTLAVSRGDWSGLLATLRLSQDNGFSSGFIEAP